MIAISRSRGTRVKDSEYEPPTRIVVNRGAAYDSVPGSVWQQSPFKWDPSPFAVESELLKDKIIEASVQEQSLKSFIEDPTMPVVYGVSGNPNDAKAKLFAAYLLDLHCKRLKSQAMPLWHILYGGYENRLLKDYGSFASNTDPSIIVISNLASNSTPSKLEKAKDILERFSSVPRIVVCAGEDPISFLSSRLYVQCNALAYFSDKLVKLKTEIY